MSDLGLAKGLPNTVRGRDDVTVHQRHFEPARVAAAALEAARSGETGQAWVVQPGRDPLVYEFRGVPGPR